MNRPAVCRGRGTRAVLGVAAMVLAAGCTDDDGTTPAALREGPLGSLRDLVLYQRSADEGWFFLDRFEVTQGDWAQWLAATGAPPDQVLLQRWGGSAPPVEDRDRPISFVSLTEARAFARWRLCRLPRWDEWRHAASGRDQFPYPWGATWSPSRANTAELGLFEPTLVGTFEGGRQGDGPYDLLGNVGEWTESLPAEWYSAPSRHLARVRAVRQHPAVRPWLLGPTPLPGALAQISGWAEAPRLVVGRDFASAVDGAPPPGSPHMAGDRSERVGLRIGVTPRELLLRLLDHRPPLSPSDRAVLDVFLGDPRHRAVMGLAWNRLGATAAAAQGPVATVLREALGR